MKIITTKTATLKYVRTTNDDMRRAYPTITLIPDDTTNMNKCGITTVFNDVNTETFTFEYVICDGYFDKENAYESTKPVKMRVRFWRLKPSEYIVDSAFYEKVITREYNFGCELLKALNEGLTHFHRGRYIANNLGESIIHKSEILRRIPTVKDSPYNYGNPLMGPNEDEEMDYDEAGFKNYYGMFGSKDLGQTERDDQDAVALFPV
jgi:hypothetical protein